MDSAKVNLNCVVICIALILDMEELESVFRLDHSIL